MKNKKLNDKRTMLRDLEGDAPAVVSTEALRLAAGGLPPVGVGGGTCTLNDDTDGLTCTLFDDED